MLFSRVAGPPVSAYPLCLVFHFHIFFAVRLHSQPHDSIIITFLSFGLCLMHPLSTFLFQRRLFLRSDPILSNFALGRSLSDLSEDDPSESRRRRVTTTNLMMRIALALG